MIVEYPPTGPADSFAKGNAILGDPLDQSGSGLCLVVQLTNGDKRFFNFNGDQKDPSNAEVFTLQPGAKVVTQPES